MKFDTKTTHFSFFLEVLKVIAGICANIPQYKMYKCLNAGVIGEGGGCFVLNILILL